MARLFSPHDFYLLRRPLLPVEAVVQLNEALNRHQEDGLGRAMARIFGNPQLQEAIHAASPDVHNALTEWLAGEMTEEKKVSRLLQTLYKYYIRMATRCTPYGLFAGCTTGTVAGEKTEVVFTEPGVRKHARLNMNYVAALAARLTSLPHIRAQIRFVRNNSLYRTGDKYRYVEFALTNNGRTYRLASVSASVYIDRVLERAGRGATLGALAGVIADEDVTPAQAEAFVISLIESQLLISELEPTVTGEEFFSVLIGKLKEIRHTETITSRLEEVAALLRQQEGAVGHHRQIGQIVKEFIPTGSNYLVQTDLYFSTDRNIISRPAIDSLTETMERLLRLGPPYKRRDLEEFKKKFSARFEQQEVPLLTALDSEFGVGYGLDVSGNSDHMPLLNQLAIPGAPEEATMPWHKTQQLVFKKLKEFIRSGQSTIQLTDADIDAAADPGEPLRVPQGMYLLGNLLAPSPEALDQGNFKFALVAYSGVSAAILLTRFCHGSEALAEKVQQCLWEEEKARPDAIFAEIVHLPQAGAGNMIMHPQFMRYEIPYLGKASVPEDFQIPLDDLMVSVREDRVVLRSRRLNKEVLPRLTNPHNFVKGLPAYKFLCDAQFQHLNASFYWQWGVYAQEVYLPRIEYRNVILSRARWYLKKADHPQLPAKDAGLADFFGKLQQQWNIPRYTVIRDDDNELLVDFTCIHSLRNLAEALRKGNVELLEYLSLPGQCFLKDEKGSYANEVIIPLRRVAAEAPPPRAVPAPAAAAIQRRFISGSEWLYVKVYTGNKTADRILTEYVKPLTERLEAEGVIDQWFYIRYNDPDPHLRLRFHHASRPDFWAVVITQLHAVLDPLISNGMVVKVVTDTYQREIERYGANTMALSEAFFHADSVALAAFLDLIEGDEGERYRWLFALRNIDTLLDDFGLDLTAKDRLLRQLQGGFYAEFTRKSKSSRLLYSLNDKYRAEARAIESILGPQPESSPLLPAVDCFRRRSERHRRLVADLATIRNAHPEATLTNEALLPSYIHMTMNRTFLARQRMHELVVYHFLSRYYESRLARRQAAGEPPGKKRAAVALH